MTQDQDVLDFYRRELPHHADSIARTPAECCPVETCIRKPHDDATWHSNGITNWRGDRRLKKPLRIVPVVGGEDKQQ